MVQKINKKILLILAVVAASVACNKENSLLLPQYNELPGTWDLHSVSYDSSGVRVTKTLPYNRLIIYDNLDYMIFMDKTNPVEEGTIEIISQSTDRLVLYFSAHYPSYSSFAGSHIFGMTNVDLLSVTGNQMVIRTINAAYGEYTDREIYFIR
jgi:hypothetical protein